MGADEHALLGNLLVHRIGTSCVQYLPRKRLLNFLKNSHVSFWLVKAMQGLGGLR